MVVVNGAQGMVHRIPAPLSLARQPLNIRFDGSNPQLHGVALVRHAVEPARSNHHGLPVNLDGVGKEAGFVLDHCEHDAVAADAATEGAASDAIGHSGASMNGRVHCTPSRLRGKGMPRGPDYPTAGTSLSSAVLRLGALGQGLDGNLLRFLKSGSARAERAGMDLDHRAVVNVHRKQPPLPSTPTPDVGSVRMPGSVHRQRDAMKRLWCLVCRHFYCRLYSRPKSAFSVRTPQAWGPEALSVEGTL